MDFGYETIRLWERAAEDLLAGELGTVPLAPLGRLPAGMSLEQGLASIVERVVNRLLTEGPPDRARRLLTAAYVLTGLRVHRDIATQLFKGVRAMRESDTYLAIVDEGREEGRVEEARKLILLLGTKRFGPLAEGARASLTAETDLDRLEQLGQRLLEVSSWEQLLETP